MTFTVNLKFIHQFNKKAAAAYIEAGHRYALQKNAGKSSEYISVLHVIYTALSEGFYYGYRVVPKASKKNDNNNVVAKRNQENGVPHPPEYDYIADFVERMIDVEGANLLRMVIPPQDFDSLVKAFKVIFSRRTPEDSPPALNRGWILRAGNSITNCEPKLDAEIPTFAQFKQSVLPSIKVRYAFYQRKGSLLFRNTNPVHRAQNIPDAIQALTLQAKLAKSNGRKDTASMRVLAETFVHGLGL